MGVNTTGAGQQLQPHTGRTSVSLPPFPNSPKFTFTSDGTGKTALDEGDSEVGWELADRGEQKIPGVEVVVERHVERWENEGPIMHGNAV